MNTEIIHTIGRNSKLNTEFITKLFFCDICWSNKFVNH